MLYSFFVNSFFHMVNVGDKRATFRSALAVGEIFVGEKAFVLIKEKYLPKGDVLSLAEISGIFGAKKTSDFLALCHPIFLNCVSVLTILRESDFSIIVYCFTSSKALTGVEMEALCGVSISLLTIYDLVKVVTCCLVITNLKLLLKIGGKSFVYIENSFYTRFLFILFFKYKFLPFLNLNVAVVSVGTRVKEFDFIDNSGIYLCMLFKKYGAVINDYLIINDDISELKCCLNELLNSDNLSLIVVTGGTGPGCHDISSCVVSELCFKKILGISEMLRLYSSYYSKFSWLSNTIVGITKNNVLFITVPGNVNAVCEYFFLLVPILIHVIKLIRK